MKTFLSIFLIGLIVLGTKSAHGANPPANPALTVGISPFLDAKDARLVLTNLNRLLLTLPPGTEFSFANGYDGSLIASGTSPRLPFDSPGARAKALSVQLVALRNWLISPSSTTLEGAAALNPPRFLRFVAGHGSGDAGRPVVLLIGSPLYRNALEPSFDFAPDRLPALANLALREEVSPFGCAGRGTLLNGTVTHWWYLAPTQMPFDAYENASRTWWQSWLRAQSGELGSYSHDWATVAASLFQPTPALYERLDVERLAGQNPRPEMISVPRRMSAPAIPVAAKPSGATESTNVPVVERACATVHKETSTSETNNAPLAQPIRASTIPPSLPKPASTSPPLPSPHIEIPPDVDRTISSVGVLWRDRGVDVDISLRVKPGGSLKDPGELYWNTPPRNATGCKTNALGRYLHDFRSGDQDYEWIELASEVDAASLASHFEVWCDNFSGRGPVNITAAILDHGRIVATRDLVIKGDGDSRKNARTRENSTSWLRLPLEEMMTLDRSQ
jgi:hypothetical protein